METNKLLVHLQLMDSQIQQLSLYIQNSAKPDRAKIWTCLCRLEATSQLLLHIASLEKPWQ